MEASSVAVPDVTIERLEMDKKSFIDCSAIFIGRSSPSKCLFIIGNNSLSATGIK